MGQMKKLRQKYIDSLRMAWGAIAEDIENANLTQDEVIELASDADRMLMYGCITEEENREWHRMSFAEKEAIAKKAFPNKWY